MVNVAKVRPWFPALWAGLALALLAGDYLAGPYLSLSILFLIPVALSARFSGVGWGVAWGILLPTVHLGFNLIWPPQRPLSDSVLNAVIRMVVLVLFAVLIARITRQAQEIRALRGLIPMCAFCKKIRVEDRKWQPIEHYITANSEAVCTSTFCPECAAKHYGEYFGGAASASTHSEPGEPLKPSSP